MWSGSFYTWTVHIGWFHWWFLTFYRFPKAVPRTNSTAMSGASAEECDAAAVSNIGCCWQQDSCLAAYSEANGGGVSSTEPVEKTLKNLSFKTGTQLSERQSIFLLGKPFARQTLKSQNAHSTDQLLLLLLFPSREYIASSSSGGSTRWNRSCSEILRRTPINKRLQLFVYPHSLALAKWLEYENCFEIIFWKPYGRETYDRPLPWWRHAALMTEITDQL